MVIGRLLFTFFLWHFGERNVAESADRLSSRKRRLTSEEQLIGDLLRGYDTDARAVINSSSTVTVQINYMMLRIQRLDERSQVLTTTAIVLTDWVDERLTWDPSHYTNIKDIVVRANRIWTPELAIINGAEEMIQEFEKIRVQINSEGGVHWEPGGVFATTCDIDILYFPFDTQACPIEIGAWAYKSSRMNLTNVKAEVEIEQFKINGEWNIVGTTVEWREVILPGYLDNSYSKVVFTIRMSRRYIFYVMNIILPCTLLSSLILVVFCVPPSAGEKISVGISVLLAFTVFLLMLADSVPRTSLVVPILVIYLSSTMALGTASVCLTVLVLNLHHRTGTASVPRWVRIVFLQHLARIFGLLQGQDVAQQGLRELQHRHFGEGREGGAATGSGTSCRSDDSSHFDRITNASTEMASLRPLSATGAAFPRGPLLQKSASCGNSHHEPIFLKETMQYHNIDPATISFAVKDGFQSRKDLHSASSVSASASVTDDCLKDWQLLARVIDRLFFVLVSLLMISSASLILFSPWYKTINTTTSGSN